MRILLKLLQWLFWSIGLLLKGVWHFGPGSWRTIVDAVVVIVSYGSALMRGACHLCPFAAQALQTVASCVG